MPGSHKHFRGGFENLFKDISGLVQSCGDYMFQVGLVELLCRLLPASEFARQDFAATFLPGNEAANVRIGTVKDQGEGWAGIAKRGGGKRGVLCCYRLTIGHQLSVCSR